jgi:hypothetical protein
MCNNGFIRQMKRFFSTSLALLLVMGSLGHAFAAAFCPGSLARECCAAKTSNQKHDSSSCHHDMTAQAKPMDDMSMDDMAMQATSVETPNLSPQPIVDARVPADMPANKLEQPDQFCAHCWSHSGGSNAPASFVTVQDESRKAVDSAPLPVSSFRSLTPARQNGSPREHAPPRTSVPRRILISVFLI